MKFTGVITNGRNDVHAKGQGQRSRSKRSKPNSTFLDRNSSLNSHMVMKLMNKAWCCLEEVPYCFSRSSIKVQGHSAKKNHRFWPKLGISGLYFQFEFTNGYQMMHKARSSIVEVPYCFIRSYVKFQGRTALKIVEFDPNCPFPDCYSSLNSPMAMKCCTKLETAKERCPIVFQGHPSNFKVTRYKTSPIFYPNWAFPDYRPVAAFKSLRFALFKVIRQISRSHGSKNRRIWPKLGVSVL